MTKRGQEKMKLLPVTLQRDK